MSENASGTPVAPSGSGGSTGSWKAKMQAEAKAVPAPPCDEQRQLSLKCAAAHSDLKDIECSREFQAYNTCMEQRNGGQKRTRSIAGIFKGER
jgi:hypothetical protein